MEIIQTILLFILTPIYATAILFLMNRRQSYAKPDLPYFKLSSYDFDFDNIPRMTAWIAVSGIFGLIIAIISIVLWPLTIAFTIILCIALGVAFLLRKVANKA